MTGHTITWIGDALVVKRYRPDAGDRPWREWHALRILHEYAPGLAPEPVAADLDVAPPSITMTALPGTPLGGRPLSEPELGAVRTALVRLHSCVPQVVLNDVPVRTNDPRHVMVGLARQLSAASRPDEDDVVARACDEALRWLSGSDANRLRNPNPHQTVLARADHNLTNFLWDGHLARMVDFEYAGRADRCVEIAELIEHISARCTPDGAWQTFLDALDLSSAEHARVSAIRRLLAIRWLGLLLPGQPGHHRNPPGTLRDQAERTLTLLGA